MSRKYIPVWDDRHKFLLSDKSCEGLRAVAQYLRAGKSRARESIRVHVQKVHADFENAIDA